MKENFVTTNGVKLHVVEAGPQDGPLVVLLHGFPEFWYSWRKQIEALAAQGFRVVAPDQRGYNLSDKPKGVASYAIDTLGADIAGLIDAYGGKKATVVGHDWGAAVAWWMGINRPEVLERLAILNVPHPAVMQKTLRKNLKQLLKSWYIFFFQLPFAPETFFKAANFRIGAQSLVSSSRLNAFSEQDLEQYRKAWAQPGAVRSMINWYRAALRKPTKMRRGGRVSVPTLMIWGAQDKFLSREMAQPSIERCERGELVFFENATHWVHEEEPQRVNELLIRFCNAPA